jgi:hypothetical protein
VAGFYAGYVEPSGSATGDLATTTNNNYDYSNEIIPDVE